MELVKSPSFDCRILDKNYVLTSENVDFFPFNYKGKNQLLTGCPDFICTCPGNVRTPHCVWDTASKWN